MNKYIGFKTIDAEPMTDMQYEVFKDGGIHNDYGGVEMDGYKVVYQDGYVSWSPKEIFEKSYMQVSDNNTITQDNVDHFIDYYEDTKIGDKTTVVRGILINGFEIIESSSCVDPANYSQELGAEICKGRIKNKVWELLGFLLQTAKNGIK